MTTPQICYPVVVRTNFVAQICVPRDLTKEEADRLCAFINALVMPDQPKGKP